MTHLPNVSFIATFYNKSAYIPAVLQGLVAQRGLGMVEYILIDDGSTDDTAALLTSFADTHQNVRLVLQNNQGPTPAYNNGIALARHPFIKFVDGDDILHPDLTHRLYAILDRDNAVAVYAKPDAHKPFYALFDTPIDPGTPLPDDNPSQALTLADHLRLGVGNPSTLLCRTDAVRASRGFDERIFNPDNGLNLGLCLQGKTSVAVIPGSIAFPAQDKTRMSSSHAQLLHDDIAIIYHVLNDNKTVIPQDLQRKSIARQLRRASRDLQKQKYIKGRLYGHACKALSLFAYVVPLPLAILLWICTVIREFHPGIRRLHNSQRNRSAA